MNPDVKARLLKALAMVLAMVAVLLFAGSLFVMQTDAQGAFVFLISLPLIALLLTAVMVMTMFIPPAFGRRGLRWTALGLIAVIGLFVAGARVPALEPFSDGLVAATRWLSVQVLGMTPWDWAHRH